MIHGFGNGPGSQDDILYQKKRQRSRCMEASERALEDAKIHAEEIDLIIVATISSNVVLPCTACEVQKKLGAKHAVCFDLNAACTGFLFAYNTAQTYIAAGLAKCATCYRNREFV